VFSRSSSSIPSCPRARKIDAQDARKVEEER
jgi:hypothetical protein